MLIFLPCMGIYDSQAYHTLSCCLVSGHGTHMVSTTPSPSLQVMVSSGRQLAVSSGRCLAVYYPTLLGNGSHFTGCHFAGDEKAHICLL